MELPDPITLCGTNHTLLRNPGGLTGEYPQKTVEGTDPCGKEVLASCSQGMKIFGAPIEVDNLFSSFDLMIQYFSPDELNCIQSYVRTGGGNQRTISYWNFYNRSAGTEFSLEIDKAYIVYMHINKKITFIGTPLSSMHTSELKEGLNSVDS
ncbi:MAG: hypothetical protein ACMUIP_06295 [bacterium]